MQRLKQAAPEEVARGATAEEDSRRARVRRALPRYSLPPLHPRCTRRTRRCISATGAESRSFKVDRVAFTHTHARSRALTHAGKRFHLRNPTGIHGESERASARSSGEFVQSDLISKEISSKVRLRSSENNDTAKQGDWNTTGRISLRYTTMIVYLFTASIYFRRSGHIRTALGHVRCKIALTARRPCLTRA